MKSLKKWRQKMVVNKRIEETLTTYYIGLHSRARLRLYNKKLITCGTSPKRCAVTLWKGRLGKSRGSRKFYEVTYERPDGFGGFLYSKVTIQTASRKKARREFELNLEDQFTA
jgi:hypothetical protein